MARYKTCNYAQRKFIPVAFEEQILPGTVEYTLAYLIDHELSLRAFDRRYRNDTTGASAYNPRVLLKIILYAYSRGILSSRRIAEACRTHIIFIALSADAQPHFTTIADFISSSSEQITALFRNVLLVVCDEMGLISKEMFAIDGCKLPSNASKEWSGTRADFQKKVKKLEGAIRHMVDTHQALDQSDSDPQADWLAAEKRQIEKLQSHTEKLQAWLAENEEDKKGHTGGIHKSNLTDPDSAKMTRPYGTVLNSRRLARRVNPRDGVSRTGHGIIQGYEGVAAVDAQHQFIVEARAYVEPQEHHLLQPMVEGVRDTFWRNGYSKDIFNEAEIQLTADAEFHTADNMQWLEDEEIDAYVADNRFRKRDPRFQDAERHKPDKPKLKRYIQADFTYDPEALTCRCHAGHALYLKNRNFQVDGHKAIAFMARQSDCSPCAFRAKCLKDPNQKSPRQIHFFDGSTTEDKKHSAIERTKRKIEKIGLTYEPSTFAIACMMTRSTTQGIPSRRTPPVSFGLSTRGAGRGL